MWQSKQQDDTVQALALLREGAVHSEFYDFEKRVVTDEMKPNPVVVNAYGSFASSIKPTRITYTHL